jgi:hypothetical protein
MLPDEIQADVGALLSELQTTRFRVINSRYDANVFGNYYVDLVGSRGSYGLRATVATITSAVMRITSDSLVYFAHSRT